MNIILEVEVIEVFMEGVVGVVGDIFEIIFSIEIIS